jgi:hypothetical protein
MRQVCKKCGKEFKDGDRVKAVVLSIYHQISSSVSYAIEKPYECTSLEHVECGFPDHEQS